MKLFKKRKASKDGLTASCRACLSVYDKARANLPHRVEARKEYTKTLKGKDSHKKATKKYRKNHSKKYKAHTMLNNSIRKGDLIKPKSCEECLLITNVVGHHDDYNKPLTVRWLCHSCHARWHQENGEGKNA